NISFSEAAMRSYAISGSSGGGLGLVDANRKDERLEPFELEFSLERVGRLVVQHVGQEGLAPEDQLAREEDRAREVERDLFAQLFELRHEIDAERIARFRVPAEAVGELDVALEILLGALAQVVDLRRALELARIDHADGDENDV